MSAVQLHRGSVMHHRLRPKRNRFNYPFFFLALDVDQLPALSNRLLKYNRRGLLSVHDRDHGDGGDPRQWIRTLLAREQIPDVGKVVLVTLPRVFGFVFNPVSFWLCHNAQGELQCVVAEVNNTFGERHCYLLAHESGAPIGDRDWLVAKKVFHVSPFLQVEGEYRFQFSLQNGKFSVHIHYYQHGKACLLTSMQGDGVAASDRALLATLMRQPLLTFGVVARINWQALRLWLKRLPFYRKPHPPLKEITR